MDQKEESRHAAHGQQGHALPPAPVEKTSNMEGPRWKRILGIAKAKPGFPSTSTGSSTEEYEEIKNKPEKWSMGVLNDTETDEVPGTL